MDQSSRNQNDKESKIQDRQGSKLTLASLCTGYGGLDMAAMVVFGGKLLWCADNDKHVAQIIAARYPGIPNYGDLTVVDWSQIPPVDIICAGFPCQDISYSGNGLGIEKGERSGIWKNIITGIRALQPKLIIVENVAALRSRGIARVLGDLVQSGYDAIWTSLRASDVGAPHRRERVFILGYSRDEKARDLLTTAHTMCQRESWWPDSSQAHSSRPSGSAVRCGDDAVHEERAQATARPTARPTADPSGQQRDQGLSQTAKQRWQLDASLGSDRTSRASSVGGIAWGRYEAAIHRWEALTGRTAPYPVERGTRGQPRLAAAFSEWLMGLPTGFVTDLGLPYSAQHRALGNGVVPQQAIAALWQLVTMATGQQAENNTVHERGLAA
jgi:DNA (cytosine-5)-methyltransferase 1